MSVSLLHCLCWLEFDSCNMYPQNHGKINDGIIQHVSSKTWPDKWWDLILTVGELFSNLTLNLQDLISRIRAIFNCVNSVLMCCDATFSFVLFLNTPIFCSSSWYHSLIEQLSLCWLHVHTQTNPHHLHSLPGSYCRNIYSTSKLIPSLWYSLIQFDILYHPLCRPLSFRCLLSTVHMR